MTPLSAGNEVVITAKTQVFSFSAKLCKKLNFVTLSAELELVQRERILTCVALKWHGTAEALEDGLKVTFLFIWSF